MVPPPPPPRIDGSPTHPVLENMLKPRRGGGQHLPLSRRSLVFILLFFSLLMAGTFSRPLVDEVRRISCCPGALKWIEFEGKWKEGWFHLCFVPMRLLDEALGGSPVEAKKKNRSFIGVSSISFPGHPNGEDRSGSGPGFNWAGPSLESGECWLWHGIQFLIPFLYFFFAFCLNYLPVHLKRSNTIGVYLVDYSAPVIGTVPFAVGSSFCQLVRLITDWQVLISFARLLRSDPLPWSWCFINLIQR